MIDFFRKLFDTRDFMPLWEKGNWGTGHGYLHLFSDLTMAASFIAIPLMIGHYCRVKKRDLLFKRTVTCFGLFIILCGLTQLTDAIMFYSPAYRFLGVMKLATAVVAVTTLIALWRNLPFALDLPGQAKLSGILQEELEKRKKTEKELSEAHEKIHTFASLVAHDVRNPLASALMMAEMAKEQTKDEGDTGKLEQSEALITSLTHIQESLERLERSSLERQVQQNQIIEPVDLGQVVKKVQASLASSILANHARMSVGKLPTVMGQTDQFFHLFTNLIENAIKYRGEKSPLIKIASEKLSNRHRISVCDNGIGIPAEEKEWVFDPEFRGERGQAEPGTGMGLSYSQRIAQEHGGGLSVRDSEIGGTCFIVDLPVADS